MKNLASRKELATKLAFDDKLIENMLPNLIYDI